MSSLRDKVSKNFSKAKKTEFERRVNELSGAMSEMAAIQLVLGEMFREGKENGGIMGGATYEDFEEFMKLQEQMNKEINKKRLLEQFEQYMKRKKLVEVADGGRIGGISKLLGE